METTNEAILAAKEQSMILKGKRTKRQRPHSPIPFSIVPSQEQDFDFEEDSTSLVSKEKSLNDEITNTNNNNKKNHNNLMTSSTSASSSSMANEEDQDMAYCLILLAQGHQQQQQQTRQLMLSTYQESGNNNNNNNDNNNVYRSSSRRFLETSTPNGTMTNINGGKVGYYVYQCKTCDRTFPSFQALGGHRASHKKPKTGPVLHSNHDLKKSTYNDTVSLHLNNNNHRSLVVYGKASHSTKVHECGICGAEFTSGQALGGHMRRHRGSIVASGAVAVAASANTALSLSPMSFNHHMLDGPVQVPVKRARSAVVSLDLDLNLPAPEDENRVNGLTFASNQEHEQTQQREEQKSLVMSSAPTLVDCHY